jgi:hypothetical protein
MEQRHGWHLDDLSWRDDRLSRVDRPRVSRKVGLAALLGFALLGAWLFLITVATGAHTTSREIGNMIAVVGLIGLAALLWRILRP